MSRNQQGQKSVWDGILIDNITPGDIVGDMHRQKSLILDPNQD